jgi:hypothetical protein
MGTRPKQRKNDRLFSTGEGESPAEPLHFGSAGTSPSLTIEAVIHLLTVIVLVLFLPLAGFAQQPRTSPPDGAAAVAQLEKTLVDVIARAEPSLRLRITVPAMSSSTFAKTLPHQPTRLPSAPA